MACVTDLKITLDGKPQTDRLIAKEFGYNGSAVTTVLFPRLNVGSGADSAPAGVQHGYLAGYKSMRLLKVGLNTRGTWASGTSITLSIGVDTTFYATIATAVVPDAIGPGAFIVDFLELAGDHTVPPGYAITIGITPGGVSAHDYTIGNLFFQER